MNSSTTTPTTTPTTPRTAPVKVGATLEHRGGMRAEVTRVSRLGATTSVEVRWVSGPDADHNRGNTFMLADVETQFYAETYRVHHRGEPLAGDDRAYHVGPADAGLFADLDEAIAAAKSLDGLGDEWDMDVVEWNGYSRRVVWGA